MGIRFQRRLNLFKGFGLNFSRSGISWSIKGPGGTVGSKRYSIRTGIPGLTYIGGYGKKRRKGISLSTYKVSTAKKYSSDYEPESPALNVVATFFAIAIVLIPGYIIVDIFFPSYKTLYKIIWFIIIGIPVVIIIYKIFSALFRTNKTDIKQQESTATDSLKTDSIKTETLREMLDSQKSNLTHVESDQFENIKNENEYITFDGSLAIPITNICYEIESIFTEFQIKHSISNPFCEKINFPNATENSYNTIPFFDICKSFYYLGLEINETRKERDVLLLSCAYFMIPRIEYDEIIVLPDACEQVIRVAKEYMFAVNPFSSSDLLIGPIVLNDEWELKIAYISKLKELIGVLTTVDFSLDKKEKELLKILQKYSL